MHASLKVCALLALCSGCPSTSLYRTADPVEPGEWRFGGALGVGVIADSEQGTRFPTGQLELSARRGVREGLDVGGKLYLAGAEVNATWRVYKNNWSFALAPALSGVKFNENNVVPESVHVFAQVHGIASRPLNERWTLSVGPSSGWGLYWPAGGGSEQGAWLGGFIHTEAKLGTHWRFTPELTTYQVFAGSVPVRGNALQFGVGVSRSL